MQFLDRKNNVIKDRPHSSGPELVFRIFRFRHPHEILRQAQYDGLEIASGEDAEGRCFGRFSTQILSTS